MRGLQVHANEETLARAAAQHFVDLAVAAIAARGSFYVALAGGSTPRTTYGLLAEPPFAERVDWTCVHVCWGDERCVPPDHPDSNYRMAAERLLDRTGIPPENVHRIRGEAEPLTAAGEYERTLIALLGRGVPKANRPSPRGTRGTVGEPVSPGRFDLILLGMGADGHTASLFPGTPAVREKAHWVVAHYLPQFQAWRVTLTPVILNAASQVTFLVAGADKADALQRVLQGPDRPEVWPAQIVNPVSGRLQWLVDAAAGGGLRS